jgi:hypothetical protein
MPIGLDAEAAAVIPASTLILWVSVAVSGAQVRAAFFYSAVWCGANVPLARRRRRAVGRFAFAVSSGERPSLVLLRGPLNRASTHS